MTKIRLTKQFDFEAAHALEGYHGKCKDIHGHTYHLEVTVTGDIVHASTDVKDSMVIDFNDLKKIVKENIIDNFDHQLILYHKSKFAGLVKENERTMLVKYIPTCENILIDIVHRLKGVLPGHLMLYRVFLRETPRSFAEWYQEDNA